MKRIRLYREADWPEGAPEPRMIREAGARLLVELERSLSARARVLGVHGLVIHANRQVAISMSTGAARTAQLRMHWCLLDEPSLASWLADSLTSGRLRDEVGELVRSRARQLDAEGCYATKPGGLPLSQGRWIELGAVLADVLRQAPVSPQEVEGITIGWGRRQPIGPRQQRIRLGSMNVRTGAILIHRMLDDAWIPRHVIEYIVWHEVCHYLAPPLERGSGERRVHHARFRALEAWYPRTEEASSWIREHLDTLMRRYRRRAQSER